ncbi:MAG: D-aminoacyl-tRNA deacylase [Pseudomonadota bacterium]
MKCLVQRVARARVEVAGEIVGQIDSGLLVFVGVVAGDTEAPCDWLADKLLNLRIFPDADKPMNRSVTDVGGELLVVSQFTLAADTSRGRRPSFGTAAEPAEAQRLYELLVGRLRERGAKVATGRFGADMQVELINDGPVTFLLERD